VKLRVILVDDESLARRLLAEYLAADPEVEIVAECANGFEAVKAVAETDPDLLFLDIQMPKLDGFEVLELLDPAPAVIFVTAYDEFALRAFEIHAVDYLLKPFTAQRLSEAVARARVRLDGARSASRPRDRAASLRREAPEKELLADVRRQRQPLARMLVRDGEHVHVLPVESVDYFEAYGDYVKIISGKQRLLKQETLSCLETLLDAQRFVRIHRSFILNVERMEKLEPYTKDSRVAILRDGRSLPVSKAGYRRLRELL
jgi:two-component system LytT family response regulator